MSDLRVEEEIVVNAAGAVGPLNRINSAVGRVTQGFGGLKTLALTAGGISGLFALGESISQTNALYETITRIRAVTGATAENTHAMLDAFELSGVEMADGESILVRLAAKTEMLSGTVSATGKQSDELGSRFRRLGVEMTKGPHRALIDMATAAKKGSLGISDLTKTFGIGRGSAAQMLTMLRAGPVEFQKLIDSSLEGADLIDEKTLASFAAMQQARRNLADSWGAIVGVLYKSLLPGMTDLFNRMSARMNDLIPLAQKFGSILSTHMTTIVSSAEMLVKILGANKVLNLLTGKGIGGIAKMGWGVLASKAGPAGAKNMASLMAGMMMKETVGIGGRTNRARLGLAEIGMKYIPMLMKVSQSGMILKTIGQTLLRLGPIGAVIGVIVGVIMKFVTNAHGLGTRLVDAITEIGAAFGGIISSFGGIIDIIAGPLDVALTAIAYAITLIVEGVAKLVTMAKGFGSWVYQPFDILTDKLMGVDTRDGKGWQSLTDSLLHANNEADRAKRARGAAAAPTAPGAQPPPTYQDFRGSRFDIKQNFAEGWDAGRVAVALTDKVAELGERRLQSGLVPLYSVR